MSEMSDMNNQAIVSVVMPVYNAEKTVVEAIESILVQSFQEFELIVVNDGSTDGTKEILERYAMDPRIRIHDQTNQGVTRSLNTGIALARGKYIARADADDFSDRKRLEIQHGFLERNPEVVLVASDFEKLYPDGKTKRVELPPDHASLARQLFVANNIMHGSVMFRRDSFHLAGGYAEEWRHLEDFELWFRMLRIGRFASIPQALSTLRVYEGSVSALHEREQTRGRLMVLWRELREGRYPLHYVRFLLKPLAKALIPPTFLSLYRTMFGKVR